MKADHLCNFNSFALPKFRGGTLPNHFSFNLVLWMYHTPLSWYEQENLGHKAHFEAWAQSTVGFTSLIVSWITKTLCVSPIYICYFMHQILKPLLTDIITLELFCWHTTAWKLTISVYHNFFFNPLNAELNPICYLLALLAHHFLHVSRIRVKSLTLRLLMSYTYGAHILDVSRSHTTTHHIR